MNEIIAYTSDPRNNIDFMMTMGDNIYPVDGVNPTDDEFDVMMFHSKMKLERQDNFAVRRNHDCFFAINKEIELGKRYLLGICQNSTTQNYLILVTTRN